jgi:hypothetical protein
VSPLASTSVVDPRWAAHHAPVAAGTMNAACTISRDGDGDWDPTTGPTSGTPTVTYAGPCRIGASGVVVRTVDAADQQVALDVIPLTLPLSAPVQTAGARVHITAVDSNGPASLVGLDLIIEQAPSASIAVEQAYACRIQRVAP